MPSGALVFGFGQYNSQTGDYAFTGAAPHTMNGKGSVYFFDQKTFFLQDTGPDWIDPVGYTYQATNHFKSWAAYIQATARQPESAGLTRTYAFLGFALSEALALIGFVVPFVFGT